MNRMMRSGIVCAVIGLALGIFSYVFVSGTATTINGTIVRKEPTLFPPGTVILLGVGAVLVLVGYLRSSKAAPVPTPTPAVSAPAAPAAPAGWYPQADGGQRYWDGRAWTEQRPAESSEG